MKVSPWRLKVTKNIGKVPIMCTNTVLIFSPFFSLSFFACLHSQDIPHDFELKLEVYCHKHHEELSVANTPKKIRKKITDISGSVGRSVGKRLSGLVSGQTTPVAVQV